MMHYITMLHWHTCWVAVYFCLISCKPPKGGKTTNSEQTHRVSSSMEIFNKRRKIYSLWRKTRVECLTLARIQAYMMPLGGKYWWVVTMKCTSVVYGNWVLMNIISDIIWCGDIEDCTDQSQLYQHDMYRRAKNFCWTKLYPKIF